MPSQLEVLQRQQAEARTLQRQTQRNLDRRLQQQRLRGQRIQEQQRTEQDTSAQIKKQEEIKKELKTFEEGTTFDNYEKKYNKLSAEAKQLVQSPSELKATQEYQNYIKSVREYKTYQREVRAYEKTIKLYEKRVSPYWLKGEPEYKYLKQLWFEGITRKATIRKEAEKLGLEPVWSGGILKGYEDPSRKMSIFIPKYDISSYLEKFPRATEVPIAKPKFKFPPERDFTAPFKDIQVRKADLPPEFVSMSSEEDIGGIGRGVPVTRITTPEGVFVSPYPLGAGGSALISPLTLEQRKKFEEEKLKGAFVELPPIKFLGGGYEWQKELEKPKETPDFLKGFEEFFGKRAGKGELPFGLHETVELIKDPSTQPEIVSGEKFNIWTPQIYLGQQLSQTQFFKKYIKPSKEFDTFLTKPVPPELISLSATVGIGTFFAPAFGVGAVKKVAKAKQIQKQISKVKAKKLAKFLQTLKQEIVTKKAGTEQLRYLDKVYNKFFKGKPQGKENFRKLVQELYEEGYFKGVPIELLKKPKAQQIEILIDVEGLPVMKGASQFISPLVGIEKLKGRYKQIAIQVPKTKQIQVPKVLQIPKTTQIQKQIQIQKIKQVALQIPKAIQISKQIPKAIQIPKQIQIPKMGISPRIKPKPPKKPIPFKFMLFRTKEKAKIEKRMKEPVKVFIKDKGKFKKITKNPITRRQGLNLGGFVTDQTLSAQFKLTKSKGKVKEPEYKIPPNFFKLQSQKFRPYKIRKKQIIPLHNRFIEKRSYRLDTANEVRRIQLAKFLAQQKKKVIVAKKRQKRLDKLFFPFFRKTKKTKSKKQ